MPRRFSIEDVARKVTGKDKKPGKYRPHPGFKSRILTHLVLSSFWVRYGGNKAKSTNCEGAYILSEEECLQPFVDVVYIRNFTVKLRISPEEKC